MNQGIDCFCVDRVCGSKLDRLRLQSVDGVIAVLETFTAGQCACTAVVICFFDNLVDIACHGETICTHLDQVTVDLKLNIEKIGGVFLVILSEKILNLFFAFSSYVNAIDLDALVETGGVDLESQLFRSIGNFTAVNICNDDLGLLRTTKHVLQNGHVEHGADSTQNEHT